MKKFVVVAAVSAALYGGVAFAANDGLEGTTSTGDFKVDLQVGNLVVVSHLDDLTLGQYDSTNGNLASETFCIGQNNNNNVYITVSSASSAAGFNLVGNLPASPLIPYAVAWKNGIGGTALPVADGSPIDAGLVNKQNLTCANDNIALQVSVASGVSAPQDYYSDVISVQVAAQ